MMLVYSFISTPLGFRYLHEASYIDKELENWMTVSWP